MFGPDARNSHVLGAQQLSDLTATCAQPASLRRQPDDCLLSDGVMASDTLCPGPGPTCSRLTQTIKSAPSVASRLREVIVFEDMLGLKLEFAAHGNMLRRYEAAKALATRRFGPGSHGLLWSEEAAREIVRPLMAALHHCHYLRVVHR